MSMERLNEDDWVLLPDTDTQSDKGTREFARDTDTKSSCSMEKNDWITVEAPSSECHPHDPSHGHREMDDSSTSDSDTDQISSLNDLRIQKNGTTSASDVLDDVAENIAVWKRMLNRTDLFCLALASFALLYGSMPAASTCASAKPESAYSGPTQISLATPTIEQMLTSARGNVVFKIIPSNTTAEKSKQTSHELAVFHPEHQVSYNLLRTTSAFEKRRPRDGHPTSSVPAAIRTFRNPNGTRVDADL
eukprot:m.166830 g.166830  ORF g.166830 m.166830 type:complete len:248 (+) comp18172_c0_seq2:298-1041(+)